MNDFLLCMEKCIFVERKINNINLKYKDKMTIEQFNFAGKKAIVRVDFNVPLDEKGKFSFESRFLGGLPSL